MNRPGSGSPRRPKALSRAVLVWGILTRLVAGQLTAQPTNPPPAGGALAATNDWLTVEQVQLRAAALSNRTDLAPAVKADALRLYLEAQQRLEDAERQLEEAARFRREATNAPAVVAELQKSLAAAPRAVTLGAASNAPLPVLEQRLTTLDATLIPATQEQETLGQEPPRRAARLAELARLVSEARAARDRAREELQAGPPSNLDAEVRQASRDLLQSRLQYRDAEQTRYEEEAKNLNATADVPRLRLDVARQHLIALAQERELLVDLLNRRRGQETLQASSRAEQTRRRIEQLNEPLLTRLADTNAVIAHERAVVAEHIRDASARLETVATNLFIRRIVFQKLRARVEAAERVGLSRNYAIGLLLRRQRAALTAPADYREQAQRQQTAISEAQIAQFTAVDARQALDPVERTVGTLLAQLPADVTAERRATLTDEARTLVSEQRDLLANLIRDYDNYLGLLLRLETQFNQAATEDEATAKYLDQRILWIRSAEPLNWQTARREAAAIWAVLTSAEWRQALRMIPRESAQALAGGMGSVLGVVLLLVLRPRLKRRLSEASAQARQGHNTSIAPTLVALLHTFLLAVPIPLLLWLIGWRAGLEANTGHTTGLAQLGQALKVLSIAIMVWEFLRQVCRPDGLAVAHFRLPEADARLLRQALGWLMWAVPALSAMNQLFEGDIAEGLSNRLAFIPTTLVFAGLAHWLLRPDGGLGASTLGGGSGNTRRLRFWRRLAHLTAVGVPLLLALASALGYNYSARQLWLRFLASVFIALGLQLLSALLFRWVYLARRRLAMTHARKVRSAEETEGGAEPREVTLSEDETQAELLTLLGQSRRLLRWVYGLALAGCLWGIWSGLLPALQALEKIPAWHVGTVAAASPPASTGRLTLLTGSPADTSSAESATTPASPTAQAEFVSVWDLLMVLLVLGITATATRNLPGFLEMAVFSHVRFERGEGYAMTTLLRYCIVLLGCVIAAHWLRIEWSKMQWIAAAVTVGIGFGLQEIFANFVSGLILLFERPVRVGDIVTVGDVSGIVARIQIRATTIRDWDNRELILPNKELVTSRFVNWTLSDSVTRIMIPIGISYDADVRQAQALILAVAKRHPAVLADPEPMVIFEGFGDSTLNLTLRAHVSRTDQRNPTLSELNATILDEFRQAGIEIAYPQQDLHIRSVPSGFLGKQEPQSPGGPPADSASPRG